MQSTYEEKAPSPNAGGIGGDAKTLVSPSSHNNQTEPPELPAVIGRTDNKNLQSNGDQHSVTHSSKDTVMFANDGHASIKEEKCVLETEPSPTVLPKQPPRANGIDESTAQRGTSKVVADSSSPNNGQVSINQKEGTAISSPADTKQQLVEQNHASNKVPRVETEGDSEPSSGDGPKSTPCPPISSRVPSSEGMAADPCGWGGEQQHNQEPVSVDQKHCETKIHDTRGSYENGTTENDVILVEIGAGSYETSIFNTAGNKKWKEMVKECVQDFRLSDEGLTENNGQSEKELRIALEIVKQVRGLGGRFLVQNDDICQKYSDVGDERAMGATLQCFRLCLTEADARQNMGIRPKENPLYFSNTREVKDTEREKKRKEREVELPQEIQAKRIQSVDVEKELENCHEVGPKSSNSVSFLHPVIYYGRVGDTNHRNARMAKRILIDASVEKIPENAFLDCNELFEVAFAEGCAVKAIEKCAFQQTSIASIEIPASVKEVGNEAFCDCAKLHKVGFGTDDCRLRKIGDRAFCGTSLSYVVIPSSVETIGYEAFYDCMRLVSVTFDHGVKCRLEIIGDCAFSHAPISTIEIPSSVEKIGCRAFHKCRELVRVDFTDANCRLEEIQNEAFSETSICAIMIPFSVKEITLRAFYKCHKLTNVDFAKNGQMEKIEHEVFFETPISTITIPWSVKAIEYGAFANCSRLETVRFEPGNCQLTTIGDFSFSESSISAIEIPATVREIGKHAFYQCRQLTDVKFALENCQLEKIGSSAFRDTSCTIAIPPMVKEIGKYAFYRNGVFLKRKRIQQQSAVDLQNGIDEKYGDKSIQGREFKKQRMEDCQTCSNNAKVSAASMIATEQQANDLRLKVKGETGSQSFTETSAEIYDLGRRIKQPHDYEKKESMANTSPSVTKQGESDDEIVKPRQIRDIGKGEINDHDVLSGKGAHGNHHTGNKLYKEMVKRRQNEYYSCKRFEKALIAQDIVREVRSKGGRFLQKNMDTDKYDDVGDKCAIKKTSQLFRDTAKNREVDYKTGFSAQSATSESMAEHAKIKKENDNTMCSEQGLAALQHFQHFHNQPNSMNRTRKLFGIDKTEINEHDVLSGKGAQGNQHHGNKLYKDLVKECQNKYHNGKRFEKAVTARYIVDEVRKRGGRFLLKDSVSGKYNDVGDDTARIKTSQLFRDLYRDSKAEREQEGRSLGMELTDSKHDDERLKSKKPNSITQALATPPKASQANQSEAPGDESRSPFYIEKPRTNDVLCGRGAHGNHHHGNKKWKALTNMQAGAYFSSQRHEKRTIAESIVRQVRAYGGRFLKRDDRTGKYMDMDDKTATMKTSQLFRDISYVVKKKQGEKIGEAQTPLNRGWPQYPEVESSEIRLGGDDYRKKDAGIGDATGRIPQGLSSLANSATHRKPSFHNTEQASRISEELAVSEVLMSLQQKK